MGPALRVGIDKLRFVTHDIGGGFGNKICRIRSSSPAACLARKLGRPVQWTEWRTDQHMANAHGNERTFLDVEVPVKKDGTLLGFSVKAIDDCGRLSALRAARRASSGRRSRPGCYRWRNIRVDFTQVCTNKSAVSPNRGYSRMQHLWLTERIVDIVAHELDLDPVEVRKKNYVRAEDMPYTTPNGCVYDSGDYARCLDIALELIGHEKLEERRGDAESRGKLLGFGIGSTLDSGTNNFGQSMILNPELQFSGNNEVATVKLDIFGELVVTLGTVPQGQSHETVAAQVVADILGCSPDDVHVRPGHDSYWNSHAGFSGTYASQFAVTGLGAVKGAADMLASQIRRLAAVILGAGGPDEIELADGFARLRANPEAALPFMACGAIINANNAGLPPELDDVTLNCRYVYRPPFEKPDTELKYGNLTLTYATQIHACLVEVDRETGEIEVVDYAAVDDCGTRIHPQIVEGQVHGATAHALGAALWETLPYDEDGNLLTANFYDYHVPHALDMPPLRTGYIESRLAFLAARRQGHGGGRRRRDPRRVRGDPGRAALRRPGNRHRQPQPGAPGLGAAPGSGREPRARVGGEPMKISGERTFAAPRTVVWRVLNDPAEMANAHARRRALRGRRRPALDGAREDPARPRRPQDEDQLREDRGARARACRAAGEGHGRGRPALDCHALRAGRADGAETQMHWEADFHVAGQVGSMGQRVLQPIVNQQVGNVLTALDERVQAAAARPRSARDVPGDEERGTKPLIRISFVSHPRFIRSRTLRLASKRSSDPMRGDARWARSRRWRLPWVFSQSRSRLRHGAVSGGGSVRARRSRSRKAASRSTSIRRTSRPRSTIPTGR